MRTVVAPETDLLPTRRAIGWQAQVPRPPADPPPEPWRGPPPIRPPEEEDPPPFEDPEPEEPPPVRQ